ncbi:MAG TPA: hypothetical protein EYP33_03380 [Pyrodictium sp.]|nr:hypothetical protein [Pyrodictium sp.]
MLRLLNIWQQLQPPQEIPGGCVRTLLPSNWGRRKQSHREVKRAFYAYMPAWLYEVIEHVLAEGYRVAAPRRSLQGR